VNLPYHDFDNSSRRRSLVYTMDQETFPLQYTFDTPVGSNNHCGRVVFSDFHVANATPAMNQAFPNECARGR